MSKRVEPVEYDGILPIQEDVEALDAGIDYENYDPATGQTIDTFDYDEAGLLSPEDCDELNPQRLCYGCRFESECCGFYLLKNENR